MAPFTLVAYLVEDEGKQGFGAGKTMLYREPATLDHLVNRLAVAMTDDLRLRIVAGALDVQIFDSWAGLLAPAQYERFALRLVRAIVGGVADLDVPIIHFVNDGPHLLADAATSGAHVLGRWRTPLDEAAACEGPDVALQGNLDPHALFADPADVARVALDVLARVVGHAASIMSPGHGILPDTLIACEHALVEAVDQTAGRDAASAPDVCTT